MLRGLPSSPAQLALTVHQFMVNSFPCASAAHSYSSSVNTAEALRRIVNTGPDTTGGMSASNREPSNGEWSGSSHSRIGFSRVTAPRSIEATVAMKDSAVGAAIFPQASLVGQDDRPRVARPRSTSARPRRAPRAAARKRRAGAVVVFNNMGTQRRVARLKAKLTQADVAALCGCPFEGRFCSYVKASPKRYDHHAAEQQQKSGTP